MTDIPARVAHVGIAVPSIAHALAFYQDILGLEPGRPEAADGATIVGLTLGDVQIELLEPREPASPRWPSSTSHVPLLARTRSIGSTTLQPLARCSSTRKLRWFSCPGTDNGPSTTR